jgi:hypothetical protein
MRTHQLPTQKKKEKRKTKEHIYQRTVRAAARPDTTATSDLRGFSRADFNFSFEVRSCSAHFRAAALLLMACVMG